MRRRRKARGIQGGDGILCRHQGGPGVPFAILLDGLGQEPDRCESPAFADDRQALHQGMVAEASRHFVRDGGCRFLHGRFARPREPVRPEDLVVVQRIEGGAGSESRQKLVGIPQDTALGLLLLSLQLLQVGDVGAGFAPPPGVRSQRNQLSPRLQRFLHHRELLVGQREIEQQPFVGRPGLRGLEVQIEGVA